MKKFITTLCLLLLCMFSRAQTGAELKGTVKDSITGEAVIGATVSLYQGKTMITGSSTDVNGAYIITSIQPGSYTIKFSYTGYASKRFAMEIAGGRNYKNAVLSETSNNLTTVVIDGNQEKKVRIPEIGPGIDIDPEIAKHGAARTPIDVVEFSPSVLRVPGGLSIKASRPSQTSFYLGDMPMLASLSFSPYTLSQIGSRLSGVSSEFGDFVGGAVVQYLPTVGADGWKMNAEYISSSLFDKYHYNQLDLTTSAPLILKKDKRFGDGTKRLVLGFHSNINYLYQADPSPSVVGIWKVKDNVLKELESTPILRSPVGEGYIPRAELLTMDDLEKESYRDNAQSRRLMWVNKLEYRPGYQSKLSFNWIYQYSHNRVAPFSSTLMNASTNPVNTGHVAIGQLRWEHNLLRSIDSSVRSKRKLFRLSYALSAHYQSFWNKTQDAVHGDDYFDYGYVGRFKSYRAPVYRYNGEVPKAQVVNGDTVWLKNYYEQTGWEDTLYQFDRSATRNPILANYTDAFFYDYGKVSNLSEIRNSNAGLVNGMSPIGVYSNMWSNVGGLQIGTSINNGVSKSQTEQFSINAKGEVGIGIHNLKMGLYMEQRVYRSYQVNAANLWTMMFQLANDGLNLDTENPIPVYNTQGVFQDTVHYNLKFNDQQNEFSKKLRERLMRQGYRDVYGNPITPNSYIDVNSLDPSQLSLDLFTANELLGTGGSNQYVKYYGYDYLGRKQRGVGAINDFLNDPQGRNIGAFRPIYAAGYIQDMIEWKDMIIRMGLRIERFDANQPVLKDPYSLYPIRTVGEVKTINGQAVDHPSGVDQDFKVYVDDVKNPNRIVGYRKGNQWYNEDGLPIQDPAVLADQTNSGTIQPYLVESDETLKASSFQDYEPQTLILPRFAVDFPLSSKVKLFAYYDVLAQRPSNIFTPIDEYYFMRYNPTRVLNNPALKPQITTDYEIGFTQLIGDHQLLTFAASYREQRNMIQLQRFNYAYPFSYVSYGNIDFSTVKGLRLEHLYRNEHLTMSSSYVFQIADGTGSSAASQQGLISAGQPNLRSLFPLNTDIRHAFKSSLMYEFGNGKEYAGPRIKGKKVLENTGITLNLIALSGAPYTRNLLATANAQRGVVQRSPIDGTPNGSRMPWQLINNLSVYKGFPVILARNGDKIKRGEFVITLRMQNFLNLNNASAVHAFTGSPEDDGYLNSPNGRAAVESAVNAQSFVDLYNAALNNPAYYSLPRRTNISLSLRF